MSTNDINIITYLLFAQGLDLISKLQKIFYKYNIRLIILCKN